METIKKSNIYVLCGFALFFAIMLLQYSNVFFYHDDYGYASLSYGRADDFQHIDNVSLGNIFEFLKFHYDHLNGRIVAFFPMVLCMQAGLWPTRIFMAMIITFLFFSLYKVLCRHIEIDNRYYMLPVLLVSYGIFSVTLTTGCHYWFSAAFCYLLPMAFFVMFLANSTSDKILIANILCLVFASASHEVISVGVVAYLFFTLIEHFVRSKHVSWADCVYLLIAIIGFVFVVSSPGLSHRAASADNEWFYSLSFVSKIKTNIPYLIRQIFSAENNILAFFIFVISFICSISMAKSKKMLVKIVGIGCLIINGFALLISLLHKQGYYDWLWQNCTLYNSIFVFNLLFVIGSIYYYLWNNGKWQLILFLTAGIVTLSSLLLVPSDVHNRATIFFQVSIISVIVAILSDIISMIKRPQIKVLVVCLFAIWPAINMHTIYTGYHHNYPANIDNDLKLIEAAKVQSRTVLLKKLPNPIFADAQEQTYAGATYIQDMYIQYYGLPHNAKLIFE